MFNYLLLLTFFLVYNPDAEDPARTELIIGKQRNGPTGTVELNFVGELSRFEERF